MPDGVTAKGTPKVDKNKTERKTESIFNRMWRFIRESYVEVVKKASWPTWPELKKFTAVVILAVLVVGFWIGGLDYLLTQLSHRIGLGPK
jgi:preprotein translocase SecE subunit